MQAISGLMSLTGDPDGPPYRAGISVFDVMAGLHATIGVLAAINHRHETGRGQHVEVNLLSSALSGLVNQSSAYVAGGVVPFRMGNSHPSLFPYEPLPCADGDLIITAGNNGQFRKLCRGARCPRAGRRPAVRPQRGPHREPRPSCGRCWCSGCKTRTAMEWFDDIIAAGVPCGPINTIDGGVAFAEERRPRPGGAGRVRRGRGAVGAQPDHGSRRPRRTTCCRRRTSTSTATRSAPGSGCQRMTTDHEIDGLDFPTSLGTSTADEISLLGQDLTADLMGKVGFGELAFWLVALRRPTPGEVRVFEAVLVALADHGFTPTAIAARLTYLSAPDSLQGALAAGLLGGGSRFLGVTEDCGGYLHDVLERQDGELPTDDAGWDALALAAVARRPGRSAVRAGPRPPGAQGTATRAPRC